MPIDANALSALAAEYAKGMTSIRGRRVQRLLNREFAGAEYVLIVEVASVRSAVLGLSESGAGFVTTDGRGRHASVNKWLSRVEGGDRSSIRSAQGLPACPGK